MISELLTTLQKLQVASSQKGYVPGVFASQRYHCFLPYNREDENVFFTSAIVFALQQHLADFSDNEAEVATKIITSAVTSYPFFKNYQGCKTYNFFKTQPLDFFPNGKIMRHFNFFKLADDSDDTAYIYLTSKQDNSWLQQKLVKHANGTLKWNSFVPKAYKNHKAYSVYFGKNMHIEIDICVLSTILLWHHKNNFKYEKQDKDSISYILEAVISKDYITKPYIVAPCYPTTAQICYHISRLLYNVDEQHRLHVLKPILLSDIHILRKEAKSFIETLFYDIALLNLGTLPANKTTYNIDIILNNTSFFYTSVPLMIPKAAIRNLQRFKICKTIELRTKCKGYTAALLLEYEMLYKKQFQHIQNKRAV